MELQKIKPRRAICIRSKQLIIQLLEKYESSKAQISPVQFCKDHEVPVGTFYTWLRYQREGKYKSNGRFIALSPEPVSVPEPSVSLAVFASINSGELTVQLHQYVGPEYIQSILDKRRGL